MNFKKLHYQGVLLFRNRNSSDLLTHINLHSGKNERWFAREYALALQTALGSGQLATTLPFYVDCEKRYADISILDGDDQRVAVYETKALYNRSSAGELCKIARRAWEQLLPPHRDTTSRMGVFFLIYQKRSTKDFDHAQAIKKFRGDARIAIGRFFRSDHNMRQSLLSTMTPITYDGKNGSAAWCTQSWVAWGYPKAPAALSRRDRDSAR